MAIGHEAKPENDRRPMVMSHDYPSASNATVHPIGEDDLARELLRDGQRLRFAHGRHWRDAGHGFFEPVHWLARFLTADAQPPGRCLGFRYALDGTSSDQADGSLPVHLLTDVAGYREERLPHDARRYLRRLPSTGVRLVWVTDARLMRDQGYEVMMDWRRRVGRMRFAPDRERFIRSMERRLDDGSWLVLAGVRDGRLLGFMTAQVVDDTAYLYESKIATEGLRYRLSSALDHAAILAFQRGGSVSQVSAGLHQPELPGLTAYKLRQGFPVVHIATRVHVAKPVALFLRYRHPMKYYRMTGRMPDGRALHAPAPRGYADSTEHGP
jgi:hypothetical protein